MSFIDPTLLSPQSRVADDGFGDPLPGTAPLATAPEAQHFGSSFYPNDRYVDMTYAEDEVFDVLTPAFVTEDSGSSLDFPGTSGSAIPTMPLPPARPTKEKNKNSKSKHFKKKDKRRSSEYDAELYDTGKGKGSGSYQSTSQPAYPPVLPASAKPPAPTRDPEPDVWSDEADWIAGDLTQQQRNRISASKSRKKRTAEVSQLVADERSISQRHDYLTGYASQLQAEVYGLNCRLLEHRDCECALIRQYYHERRRRESGASRAAEGDGEPDG